MTSPLLRIQAVSRTYGPGPSATRALDAVDLELWPGEFVALSGPSGSGKTTLLQLAGSLDRPDEGRVLFREEDVARLGDAERARFRRRELGFIFQFFNLVPGLDALENVALPLRFARIGRSVAERRAAELLEAVELGQRARQQARDLSGGEMQRVAIARAFVARPALVLADEPTGSLDSRTGDAILSLIARMTRDEEVAVLMASHDPHAIEWADRHVSLVDGRVATESTQRVHHVAREVVRA